MSTLPPGVSLDRAARERVEALSALFREAEAQLRDVQSRLEDPRDVRYVRARIREARRVLDGLLTLQDGAVSGAVVEWAREHFPATYQMGAGMAVADLKAQALSPIAGDPRIHTRAVEALLDRYLADTTEIVVQLHGNVIRASRVLLAQSGFGQEIASGLIGGLPRRETSALLKRTLVRALSENLPEDAAPDLTRLQVGKRTMSLEAWAEMHARTETARASAAGTNVLCVVNGVEHVQITTHAHAPCICTPFEGRIYRLFQDRGDMRFPWIGVTPRGGTPHHENCVHRQAPAVVEYLEERGDVEGRTRIPADFQGLSETELARVVRANREQLRRYSEDRSGMMPEDFRLRKAA